MMLTGNLLPLTTLSICLGFAIDVIGSIAFSNFASVPSRIPNASSSSLFDIIASENMRRLAAG